jgi:hypothetical protein
LEIYQIIPFSQDGNWKEAKMVHVAAARKSRCAVFMFLQRLREIAAIRR